MKKRAVVMLGGGLGNQMYQYAYYLSLKNRNENVSLAIGKGGAHNGFELESVFGLTVGSYAPFYHFLERLSWAGTHRSTCSPACRFTRKSLPFLVELR